MTTNRAKNHEMNRNPTGKGGFGDNPQNRKEGGVWNPENSFKFQMQKFKSMSRAEFENWAKETPKEERTIAQELAYQRILKAHKELQEFREVADRTEGRPTQPTDVTSGGEKIEGNKIVFEDFKKCNKK